MESADSPNTVSHKPPLSVVSLKMLCKAGSSKMQASSAALTAKLTHSHGLCPSARTQMYSVLERWLKARSICENASTQNAIVWPVLWLWLAPM